MTEQFLLERETCSITSEKKQYENSDLVFRAKLDDHGSGELWFTEKSQLDLLCNQPVSRANGAVWSLKNHLADRKFEEKRKGVARGHGHEFII